MTAEQFAAALVRLGWSRRYLASLLGCDPVLAQRWCDGVARVPPSIGTWLLTLASLHMKHPPPDDWRVR